VLVAALAGCAGGAGPDGIEASCIPMTVDASPQAVVPGGNVTLEFEYVHATCHDRDPNADPNADQGVTSAQVGLTEVNGAWRAADLATLDVDDDLAGSVNVAIPEDMPAGTYSVMVFDREIGQIEVTAPLEGQASAACAAPYATVLPNAVVAGQQATLTAKNISDTCNDTGQGPDVPSDGVIVSLQAQDGSWGPTDVATLDAAADFTASATFQVPSGTEPGTVLVLLDEFEAGTFEVVSPSPAVTS